MSVKDQHQDPHPVVDYEAPKDDATMSITLVDDTVVAKGSNPSTVQEEPDSTPYVDYRTVGSEQHTGPIMNSTNAPLRVRTDFGIRVIPPMHSATFNGRSLTFKKIQ